MEKREFTRINVPGLMAQEKNEDYMYVVTLINLSEGGFLARGRTLATNQDSVSYINIRIDRNLTLSNVSARIVREEKDKEGIVMAYQILGMEEKEKLALRKYILRQLEKKQGDNLVSLSPAV